MVTRAQLSQTVTLSTSTIPDMQVICIGKGPSKTTVEAPLTAIEQGQSIVVRGTVTDIAAGAKQLVDDGKFNIIPAISDADQANGWNIYTCKNLCQKKPKESAYA